MGGKRVLRFLVVLTVFLTASLPSAMHADDPVIRIGMIGLDTSHCPAFVKEFNHEPPHADMQNCRVVAAYPYGSRNIESSYSRIPKYTKQVKDLGVEIVDSIPDLLSKVDAVLLETNDGNPHLEQARQVIAAGKPVFIDKPVASNLSEVVAIYRAAKQANVPIFSSSSLRYISGIDAVRDPGFGGVLGCDTHSPCSLEPSHVDLFWYGIHGVEPLYAVMGPGCIGVQHLSTESTELSVGTWNDKRVGTFRGIKLGQSGYGGTAFGEAKIASLGTYNGYRPLVVEIASFFRSGRAPVTAKETIEIYAFMQAAHESARRNGSFVTIREVMENAELEATALLAKE